MANVWQKRNLVTGVVLSELRGAKTCDLANQAACVYCQGIRIVNLLDAAMDFSQTICLLSHTDYTKNTEHASFHSRVPLEC